MHAKKYPLSRLSIALHSFGVPSSTYLKVTAKYEGKIKKNVKGMSVKNNPFIVEPAT